MTENELLVKTLKQFHSVEWINQYFDLLKRLLDELNLDGSDERLALSLTKQKTLPVNIGQRYVLKPLPGEFTRIIVPLSFDEALVGAELIGYFRRRQMEDAKWLEYRYPTGAKFPPALYNACVEESMDIMRRCKKSGYRKFHSEDVYEFTVDKSERKRVLDQLQTERA